MSARTAIRFLRQGRVVEIADAAPTRMLLDHLRLTERATGTKEGCNEGDCGACTVVLARLREGRPIYEPVNACITMLGQADGAEILTVEDLADGQTLHPVQQAMYELHGSQCGFCTPGIVMSLFALHHTAPVADRDGVCDALAGNLCRCTGYRPIVDAALASAAATRADRFAASEAARREALAALVDEADLFAGTPERFFAAPRTVESLSALLLAHPDARIVAGGTDVGLWITKQLRELAKIVWLGRVRGLDAVEDRPDAVVIGGSATYAQAAAALGSVHPDVAELLRRLGSRQVRTSGTIGGNVANGSPIGDTPPLLIALGATLELQRGSETRSLPLEAFFLDYGKQDRRPSEFVRRIAVPKLGPGEHLRAYKVSKRYDQDITAVLGAFKLTVADGRIQAARLAFGGMAATPKRAAGTERAVTGLSLADPGSWPAAVAALEEDFRPISDMRASAGYRSRVARGLLLKALHEVAGRSPAETRVWDSRTSDHASAA